MQKVKYALFYLQEYGWLNFVKKIAEKSSRMVRPAFSHIFKATSPSRPDAANSSIKIFTCPGLPARVNLVLGQANADDSSTSISMLFGMIIAARLNYDLRIISASVINMGVFNGLLAGSGQAFANNVEFVTDDTAVANHEIEVSESDMFVTTSWQTTRSVIGSINGKNVIYLLLQDERRLCQSIETRTMCTDVFNNGQIEFIVNSRGLYDQLIADDFDNIQQHGHWFNAHSITSTTDDIRIIATQINEVIRRLAVFGEK